MHKPLRAHRITVILSAFFKMLKEGLPESYILQMQFYLDVLGMEWGAYAILWPDGWRLEVFEVKRDEKLIKVILKKAKEFWKMVQDGKIDNMPDILPVAAVSAGIVDGTAVLDLDYREDSTAEVDNSCHKVRRDD